jgi:hypothetical protein
VKLPPATATAVCATRSRLLSVTQGVTEVVVIPLKLNVWLTAALVPLTATMTKVVGEEVFVFL